MKKRGVISAAIIVSGLLLFFIIINLPGAGSGGTTPGNGGVGPETDSNLQFQVNQNRNIVANPVPTAGEGSEPNNLTDNLTKDLTQNMMKINSDNYGTSTVRVPSSDSLSEMVNQSLNQNLRFPVFGDKDIRVGGDNSVNKQVEYINGVRKITEENFSGFKTSVLSAMKNFFDRNDAAALTKYVAIAENQLGDLLSLEVPQQLKTWHLQSVNLWEKKIIVFRAILNMGSDPLKTILAMKEVDGINKETVNLQNVMNDFIGDLNNKG
jgi:hypothetical protein